MTTNIEREEGLKNVCITSTKKTYNTDNHDILSHTNLILTVIFKDKHGEYPYGKTTFNEIVTNYNYVYNKDDLGNVTSCIVTRTTSKTGESSNFEKTSITTYYDSKGNVTKIEHKTRDGIVFRREQFWYYENGTIKEKKIKSTHNKTTEYYNMSGKLILIVDETFASKSKCRTYSATYNSDGDKIHETNYTKNLDTTIEIDKDSEGNILSVTKLFRHINDRKIFSKEVTIYDAMADFKLSKIFINGFLTKSIKYDLNGDEVEVFTKTNDREVMTRISRNTDSETGETTVEKHVYIISNGIQSIKYFKSVYDVDGNLIMNAMDNSEVTTYTYEDGKRMSATIKNLIDGEFVTVASVIYSYTTEDDKYIRTRTVEEYDKNGNVITKTIYTDTKSDIEHEDICEKRFYEEIVNP